MRTNGFCSHSAPIVDGSRWPGWIRVSGSSVISFSMIETFKSAKPVAPGARVPPTVPLKITSAVRQSLSPNSSAQWSAQWPGVWITRISSSPLRITSPSTKVSSTFASTSFVGQLVGDDRDPEALRELPSADDVVVVVMGEQHVGDLGALALGPLGERVGDRPFESTSTPLPPGSSTTRYAFDSHSGCSTLCRITLASSRLVS